VIASDSGALWREVAQRNHGDGYASRYAEVFDDLVAKGNDVHGEVDLVVAMGGTSVSVLDAGCGTGRVAARLADLGHDVVGVDVDPAMVEVARDRRPDLTWHVADLARLDLGRTFDVVVSAGNVIPFIPLADLPEMARALARHTAPGGLVLCGFGLSAAHLPTGAPVVPLAAYDEAMEGADLVLESRHAGWDRATYVDDGGYAVSVHRRTTT
jgi:SAM-dependent methyltransferase